MSADEISPEERILRMMKKVLTDVAKDTHAKPGFRHPLADSTVQGMRECLALISAREQELAAEAGKPSRARPEFIDEPKKSHVVTLHRPKKKPDEEKQ